MIPPEAETALTMLLPNPSAVVLLIKVAPSSVEMESPPLVAA